MRHRVKGRKLSRTSAHRKATLRALTIALVTSKDNTKVAYTNRIITTVAKAKELRRFVEPLITRSKEDNLLNRRMVFSSLQHKDAVKRLFEEIGPKVADRNGGYTRIIKIGFRQGDGADMAMIELVDYNDIKPEGDKATKKKRTRRAGKGKVTSANDVEATPVKEDKAEIASADESND